MAIVMARYGELVVEGKTGYLMDNKDVTELEKRISFMGYSIQLKETVLKKVLLGNKKQIEIASEAA